MHSLTEVCLNSIQNSRLAPLFLDAMLKSVVVLAAAAGVCLCWRRASAATRHLIWFLAVAGLPVLPWLSSVMPSWHRTPWSVSSGFNSGNQFSLALEASPAAASRSIPNRPPAPVTANAVPADNAPPGGAGRIGVHFNASWVLYAFAAWTAGVLSVLLRIAAGRMRLRKLSRQARVLQGDGWTALVHELCEELRIRRPVILRQSADDTMPMTWRWWRPVVLLPAEASRWSGDRRRVVLRHELAHVKRWDCLTQLITGVVCAFYWFNPLAWLAARRMCVEREHACDDLVLNSGHAASEYAGHLVEIAAAFRHVPQVTAIAMARPSGLEKRVTAIVDASRARRLRPGTAAAVLILIGGLVCGVGGCKTGTTRGGGDNSSSLREQQIARIEVFSAAKEKQAKTLAEAEGEPIGPDYQQFFDAATRGDGNAVTNLFADFRQRHSQYEHTGERRRQMLPHTSFWSPVLEVCLAYQAVMDGEPKYVQMAAEDIVNSIPRGSIYFGGTDPGRGLPTAFCRSQIDADPFYTLTQNALADGTYLQYLRMTYGEESTLLDQFLTARRSDSPLHLLDEERNQATQALADAYANTNYSLDGPEIRAADQTAAKLRGRIEERMQELWSAIKADTHSPPSRQSIYIPTVKDSQQCFQDYIQDATQRLHDHQLKPGENVKEVSDGPGASTRIQVNGQVAVMSINGLLAKIIFDRNPGREFYIEESFALDWMYPYLEPHGLIMKLNRRPLPELSGETVRRDHEYWSSRAGGMIGGWLTAETPVESVAAFVEKTWLRKDLTDFTGDRRFVQTTSASRSFSKWRCSIAGVYAWRAEHAAGAADRERMAREADFAFRQAWALRPDSPEAVNRYVGFLKNQKRLADARLVVETSARFPSSPENDTSKFRDLLSESSTSPL